jgi:hypothetical protein
MEAIIFRSNNVRKAVLISAETKTAKIFIQGLTTSKNISLKRILVCLAPCLHGGKLKVEIKIKKLLN